MKDTYFQHENKTSHHFKTTENNANTVLPSSGNNAVMALEYKSGGRGKVCWATMSCGGHGTVDEGLFQLTCCYENKGSSKKSVFFSSSCCFRSFFTSFSMFGFSVHVRFLNATLRGKRSSLVLKKKKKKSINERQLSEQSHKALRNKRAVPLLRSEWLQWK